MNIKHGIWGIVASVAVAMAARGQSGSIAWGVYNPSRDFAPLVRARDVRMIGGVLALKPEEAAALDALYEGYVTSLKARSSELDEIVQEAMERAETRQDAHLIAPIWAKQKEWEAEAETRKKQFLDDLKSLLSGEQAERWPIVERELRRIKQLPTGRLMGESVDVRNLVQEVAGEAAQSSAVMEVLEAYAVSVDRAMQARDAFLAKSEEFTGLIESNPTDAERMWKEAWRLRDAVRGANERAVREVSAALGPELGGRIEKKYFETAHERILGPTRGENYLKRANALTGLAAPARAEVSRVWEAYQAQVQAWQRRDVEAERAYEDTRMPTPLVAKLGKTLPGEDPTSWQGKSYLPVDHPLTRLREERFELDRRFRAEMDRALTPDQRRQSLAGSEDFVRFTDWSPGGL